jgi:hypothetical protein
VREKGAVGAGDSHAGEVHDRLHAVEGGREIARRDVDPVELQPPHAPGGLAHVETDNSVDAVHRVEMGQESLCEQPGDAGHRDRRRDHVHRLIG